VTADLHRAGQAWLLWDGTCGFCRGSVDWVKRNDKHDRVHAVPYQDAPNPPVTEILARECSRAVHVITPDGRILRAGRASLYVLGQIGWPTLAAVGSVPPVVWLVEAGYWLVARNRSLVSRVLFRPRSGRSACRIGH
jgi:predicted DCC family thiol-disulfide oxidoreductase YuxK